VLKLCGLYISREGSVDFLLLAYAKLIMGLLDIFKINFGYVLIQLTLSAIILCVGVAIQSSQAWGNPLLSVYIAAAWMGLFVLFPLLLNALGVVLDLIDSKGALALKELSLGVSAAKNNVSQIANIGKSEIHQIRRRKIEEDIIRTKQLYDMGTLNEDEYNQRIKEFKEKL